MNHRCGEEFKLSAAERKGVALRNNNLSVGIVRAIELLHHCKCLCRSNNGGLRICLHKCVDVGGMVGLHVLNDKIIGSFFTENRFDVAEPFIAETGVNAVHYRRLFVDNKIGVVSHAVFNDILPLKQVNIVVIDADILNVFCYIHLKHPSLNEFSPYYSTSVLLLVGVELKNLAELREFIAFFESKSRANMFGIAIRPLRVSEMLQTLSSFIRLPAKAATI